MLVGEPVLRTAGRRARAGGGRAGRASRSARPGAHQVINRGSEPARIVIISEMNAPDVVVRPESGKISAFGRAPGAAGEGFHDVYFRRDAVELWDGEPPPPAPDDGK